ncbi:MAG: DivIVA domain-containing protein [Bifidobacteriaceae bacterium]|nr:DivIVA domain-containing protein [Bifidobacteriaceae bacterium]
MEDKTMAAQVTKGKNTAIAEYEAPRKWGYDIAQVDEFLDRAHKAYDSLEPLLKQEDIQNVSFGLQKGGYSIPQIDAALSRLERAVVDRRTLWDLQRMGRVAWRAQTEALVNTIRGRVKRADNERFSDGEKGSPSYDRKQVDKLIREISDAVEDELNNTVSEANEINSSYVENVVFTQRTGAKGYSEAQVDAYLNRVVQILTRLESFSRVEKEASVSYDSAPSENSSSEMPSSVPPAGSPAVSSAAAAAVSSVSQQKLPSFAPESSANDNDSSQNNAVSSDSEATLAGQIPVIPPVFSVPVTPEVPAAPPSHPVSLSSEPTGEYSAVKAASAADSAVNSAADVSGQGDSDKPYSKVQSAEEKLFNAQTRSNIQPSLEGDENLDLNPIIFGQSVPTVYTYGSEPKNGDNAENAAAAAETQPIQTASNKTASNKTASNKTAHPVTVSQEPAAQPFKTFVQPETSQPASVQPASVQSAAVQPAAVQPQSVSGQSADSETANGSFADDQTSAFPEPAAGQHPSPAAKSGDALTDFSNIAGNAPETDRKQSDKPEKHPGSALPIVTVNNPTAGQETLVSDVSIPDLSFPENEF